MGRLRQPTALLEAKGSFKQHPERRRGEEPSYELANADAPDWMDAMAREAWEYYAPLLMGTKVMTMPDLHNLEAFCRAYSRWRESELDVMDRGILIDGVNGSVKVKNPSLSVIKESLAQMQQFGSNLGLDPVSRTRLAKPPEKQVSGFEEFT